jgi:hypothetical protein
MKAAVVSLMQKSKTASVQIQEVDSSATKIRE